MGFSTFLDEHVMRKDLYVWCQNCSGRLGNGIPLGEKLVCYAVVVWDGLPLGDPTEIQTACTFFCRYSFFPTFLWLQGTKSTLSFYCTGRQARQGPAWDGQLLGWEFQFLVPISGTPIRGGILIPFTIPKILVGFFFEIPISGEPENWNFDLRYSEFRQFLAQELSTSFCC